MSASILVTGASGFIGSFIVEEALNQGYVVWAGIRSGSSKEFLTDSRIRFLELDFAHPNELKAQLSGHKGTYNKWDYIVHSAGVTKCKDQAEFEQVNYIGTKNFVDVLQQLKMIPKQFVYISTLGVYGPIHETNYLPITEFDTPHPNTAYGRSKLASERYMQGIEGFPYVFFRPTGVYGPREKDYFLMAKSIKNHIDFAAGFKRQDITFVYVHDLVRAIFLAIDHRVSRKAYFISDGKVYSSRSFSDFIQKELSNPFVIHVKCPLFVLKVISLFAENLASCFGKCSTLNLDKYKIMKQRNWQCDITSLADDLGFTPEYDLERGVKETISWYKMQRWL